MNYTVTGDCEGQKRLENYVCWQRLTPLFCHSCVRMMLCSRKGSVGEG